MRPIDADEFDTKLFNDGFFGGLAKCIGNTQRKFTIGEFRGMHKKAPTIDAVPVVRCKDCMFRCEPIEFGELYCPILNGSMNNDDFCSYGERKESNE